MLSTIASEDASFFVEEFGETVAVFGLAGGDRSVTAVVERGTAQRERGTAHETREWDCTVHFQDDATPGSSGTGVGYHEVRNLEAGGRRLSLRLPEDEPTERWSFDRVLENDPSGMVVCRFVRTRLLSSGQITPAEL